MENSIKAVNEIVEKHLSNLIIEIANDSRIPWQGGDISPAQEWMLSSLRDDVKEELIDFCNLRKPQKYITWKRH